MYALDFEYDGRTLSQYGFIICEFNGSADVNVADTGFDITFNKVKRNNGKKYGVTSAQYDECMQTTFQICKNPNETDDAVVSPDEYTDLVRWLNRREFLKFRVLNEYEYDKPTCYFNASFNVKKITLGDLVYGLELTVETDSPFGYGVPFNKEWTLSDTATTIQLTDRSGDIGTIRPDLVVTCIGNGTLELSNALTGSTMKIKNCANHEVITIYGDTQIIESSVSTHKLYDDFNYEFLTIGNTLTDRKNVISASIPCKVRLSYTPIIKDVP